MSGQTELTAGCKVNLYLDIVGVRADGYHEIESLFYPLPAPFDTLAVEEGGGAGLHLTCSDPALATDGNILAKANRASPRESPCICARTSLWARGWAAAAATPPFS